MVCLTHYHYPPKLPIETMNKNGRTC